MFLEGDADMVPISTSPTDSPVGDKQTPLPILLRVPFFTMPQSPSCAPIDCDLSTPRILSQKSQRPAAPALRDRRYSIIAASLLVAIVVGIGWHVWRVGNEWTEPKPESALIPGTAVFDVPVSDSVNAESDGNVIRAVFLVPEHLPPADERSP